MTPCPPYRPLRGAEPPHFVDRSDDDGLSVAPVTRCVLSACEHGPADPRFHRLVVSEPGLGKTAMLRAACRSVAGGLGWPIVFHRCRPKERALGRLAGELLDAARSRWTPRAIAAGWTVGAPRFAPGAPERPWSELRACLRAVGEAAARRDGGMLVALDDVDALCGGEAECLGHLARSISRSGIPVAFLMSGGEVTAGQFAGRAYFDGCVWPTRLGPFDDDEAREALVVPAAERGVEFRDEALLLACALADGNPLAVQTVGFAAWSHARHGRVALSDVEAAAASFPPRQLSVGRHLAPTG